MIAAQRLERAALDRMAGEEEFELPVLQNRQ
jgi:hypothetical protein